MGSSLHCGEGMEGSGGKKRRRRKHICSGVNHCQHACGGVLDRVWTDGNGKGKCKMQGIDYWQYACGVRKHFPIFPQTNS